MSLVAMRSSTSRSVAVCCALHELLGSREPLADRAREVGPIGLDQAGAHVGVGLVEQPIGVPLVPCGMLSVETAPVSARRVVERSDNASRCLHARNAVGGDRGATNQHRDESEKTYVAMERRMIYIVAPMRRVLSFLALAAACGGTALRTVAVLGVDRLSAVAGQEVELRGPTLRPCAAAAMMMLAPPRFRPGPGLRARAEVSGALWRGPCPACRFSDSTAMDRARIPPGSRCGGPPACAVLVDDSAGPACVTTHARTFTLGQGPRGARSRWRSIRSSDARDGAPAASRRGSRPSRRSRGIAFSSARWPRATRYLASSNRRRPDRRARSLTAPRCRAASASSPVLSGGADASAI